MVARVAVGVVCVAHRQWSPSNAVAAAGAAVAAWMLAMQISEESHLAAAVFSFISFITHKAAAQ